MTISRHHEVISHLLQETYKAQLKWESFSGEAVGEQPFYGPEARLLSILPTRRLRTHPER